MPHTIDSLLEIREFDHGGADLNSVNVEDSLDHFSRVVGFPNGVNKIIYQVFHHLFVKLFVLNHTDYDFVSVLFIVFGILV